MKSFKYINEETFEQNFKRWKEVLGSRIMHQCEDSAYLSFRREWIDFIKPVTPNIPYISFNHAPVLSIDSNIIFAPFTGTAIPICLRTLSFEPSKTKLSGKVCNLARSLFVKALFSFQ